MSFSSTIQKEYEKLRERQEAVRLLQEETLRVEKEVKAQQAEIVWVKKCVEDVQYGKSYADVVKARRN